MIAYIWLPPLVFICFFRFGMAGKYEMDYPTGTFADTYDRYARIFWIIFAVALALSGVMAYTLLAVAAADVLLCAAIYALLFNVVLLYFYERYLHQRYLPPNLSSNYTAWRYATTLGLGVAALCTFIGGLCAAFYSVTK